MKTCILIFLFVGAMLSLRAQDLPACIISLKKKTIGSEREFAGISKLKDGRTLYRIKISRPYRCMDCASGVTYVDSVCKTAASFTIGFAANAFVNTDYTAADFIESTNPIFKSRLSTPRPEDPFSKPVTAIIVYLIDDSTLIFKTSDSLYISAAAGMSIYRSGKLFNQYKIISKKIKLKGSTKEKIVYYLEPFKRYFYIDNDAVKFSKRKYSDNSADTIEETDWYTEAVIRKNLVRQ